MWQPYPFPTVLVFPNLLYINPTIYFITHQIKRSPNQILQFSSMADIAMLVAEEYERRVKNSRKFGSEEEIQLFSYFSEILAQKFDGYSSKINMTFGETKIIEPKSEVGLAAINGVFSA
ncbi:hypothetical protein MTR67_019626 [Solanum verrucosum]|nr:hypothetical protein MTR67_019626 [Solanum verrucosum]